MKELQSEVIKKSISLSITVSRWGDALASKKGFGSNYSAYIADLIRRDKERDDEIQLLRNNDGVSSDSASTAEKQILEVVRKAARKKTTPVREKRSLQQNAIR